MTLRARMFDFIKRNRLGILLGGAVVIVGISAAIIGTIQRQKPTPQRTRQEIAQNECATSAFVQYNKATLVLLQKEAASPLKPTIEITIARRRLQESFCLQFAQCVFPHQTNSSLVLQHSVAFESCLRDEAREQYDAESDER